MSNKITFDVGFKANQSDLLKLRKSLTDISAMTSKQLKPQFGDQALNELTKVKRTAREVELALNKAFNPNLGSLNVSKLNQLLNKIGINKIATQFAELGATGRNAFNNLAATALTTNTKLNQTYGILDKIKTTLGNSLRWSLASSVINRMTNEIGNAFAYVKSLDASLNDIRIVTGKSADEMSSFAVEANKAAKALGQQTTAYTNAALIYYQQGLNSDQANALAETTLKVANVTGQDTAAVSEELTAVMNGYQIEALNVEGAFDSLAAVAATTAADLEELTTGMSKVAAAANSMGVGMDSLNAQVATIVSVTRQAPESVGTALKTIYARLGDLKVDGVDEFGTSLGLVSGTLQRMGINVLDLMGNLRDMEGVITEVAEKWNTWTGAQRQAAAVAMAGKRQYNNLIALFDNWGMYTDALNTSLTAQGTLSQQNAIYLLSFTAKLHQFQAALDDVKDSALDEETLKDFVDFGTDAVTLLARFIDGIGGMRGVLVGIGALLPRIFDKQLNSTFTTLLTNIQRVRHNTEEANAVLQITSKFTQYAGQLKDPQMKVQLDTLVKMRETANQYRNVMSLADNEHYNALIKQKAELMNQSNTYKDFIDKTVKYAQDISGKKILSGRATDAQTGQILNTHGSDGAYTFAEKGEENLSKIKEALDNQVTKYDKAVNDIDDIFNKDIKNRQNLNKAVETKAKDFLNQAKEAEKAASKLQKEVENLNKAADLALDKSADLTDKYYAEEYGKIPKEKSDTWKRSEEFEAQRKKLEEEAREKTKEVENLKEKADELKDQAEETREEIRGLSDIFLDAADNANEYANRLKDTPLDKYSKKIADLTTILNDNTASLEAKKSALRDLKGVYNLIRGLIEATSASIEELTKKQKAAEEQAKAFELAKALQEAQMEIQLTANRITESIQAISSFGFALNSVNGLIDSIADKNLSVSDKLAQIFTVLPMAITSSVSAISSLNTALGTNIGILDILGKAKLLDNALDTEKIGLLKILSILSKNKTKDLIANAIAIEAGTTAQEVQNAATEKGIALDKLAIATQKARWALSIVGLILAIAAAIKILLTIQEKQIEALIEENQKIYDNILAKKELIKANQDLIKSYQSIYEQYKAGTASKELMADAANSLSGILNSEAIAVANLTGNYDDLTRAVNESNEKLREEERQQAEQQGRAAANILRLKESSISDDIKRTLSFDNIIDTALAPFTGSGNVVVTGNANLLTINGNRPEDIVKTYDQMTLAIAQAGDQLGAYLRILQRYQEEYAEVVEQLRKSVEWTNDIAIRDTLANQTYDSIESFKKNVEEIEKQLIENGVSEEDAKDKAIQYASTFSKESALAFKRYATANEILGDAPSEGAIKAVHEVVNKLNEEQLSVVLQVGLDELHIDDWIEATKAAVDISEATTNLEKLNNVISGLQQGEDTLKQKALKDFKEDVEALEKEYELLGNIWDKSSNLYIKALEKIAQLEEDRRIKAQQEIVEAKRNQAAKNLEELLNPTETDYTKQRRAVRDRLQNEVLPFWLEKKSKADDVISTRNLINNSPSSTEDYLLNTNKYIEDQKLLGKAYKETHEAFVKMAQEGQDVSENTTQAILVFETASKEALEKINATQQAISDINKLLEDTEKLSQQITDGEIANNLNELTESLKNYGKLIIELEELKTEDLVTDADNIINQAENLAKAVGLINDGFKVGADTLKLAQQLKKISDSAGLIKDGFTVDTSTYELLFRIFPALASNALVLADGMIQLNEQTVKSVLESNAELIDSDTEVTANKIQNRIDELEVEKEELTKKLEYVKESNLETLQAEGVLTNLLGDYYEEYSQQVIDASAETAESLVSNAKASALQVIKWWEEKERAALHYAGIAAAAEQPGHNVSESDIGYKANLPGLMALDTLLGTIDARLAKARRLESKKQAEKLFKEQLEVFLSNKIQSTEGQIADLTIALGKLYSGIDNVGTAAKGAAEKTGKLSHKDTKDKLKDQVDIYHDINILLGDIETALNRIAKNEDKLIRSGITKNLEKQNELLDKQVETLKRKAELQQQDALNRSAELSALGATFDAYGNISNYMDLLGSKQSEYNSLIEEYNTLIKESNAAGSKDAQQAMLSTINALKDKIDLTKDDFDDLKDKIADYDSLKDAIDELQDDIIDSINKKIENNIKAFKIKIDVQLDKNEYLRDWNLFQKTANRIAEDNYKKLSENRLASFHSYYNTEGTGDVQELISQLNKTRAEVEKMEANQWSDIYGHNEAQALEDLKTYNDRLMQSLEDVEQIVKDIHDNYLSEIDKAKDAFDNQVSQYEHINKLIGHGKNLTSLLYGDDDYDKLSKYYDMQAQNSNAQIDFYRRQTLLWKQNMDAAKEGSKEWIKFRNNWLSSVSDMNAAVESAVSNLIDKYTAAVNDIVRKSKNLLAGGNWDDMLAEWDQAMWNQDRYLDDLTRASNIADFSDAVRNAMEGSTSKQQQTYLKFLDEKINYLTTETGLREYDVEVANRLLEILKQQMALEDARNAKTKMRLRRDSQGNYTYQYVADESQQLEGAANLRNLYEELRQYEKEDLRSTAEEIQSVYTDLYTALAENAIKYKDDTEKLKEEEVKIQLRYNERLKGLGADLQGAQLDLMKSTGGEYGALLQQLGDKTRSFLGIAEGLLGDGIWQGVVELLGTDGSDGRIPNAVDAFVEGKFNDATTRMSQGNQQLLFGEGGLVPGWNSAAYQMSLTVDKGVEIVKKAGEDIVKVNKEYQLSLKQTDTAAGGYFSNIGGYIESTSQQTQELIKDNQELIDKYGDEIAAVAAVCAEMAELTAAYEANRDAALECAEANYKMWQSAEGFNPDTVSISSQTATRAASEKAKAATGNGGEDGDGPGSGKVDIPTKEDPSVPANLDKYYYLVGSTGKIYDKNDNLVGQWNRYQTDPYGVANTAGLYDQNGKLLKIIKRYKSGGYTGTWSNGSYDGMPALLHQKEYVLNAQDTPNVLRAVLIANRIMDSLSGLGTTAIDSMLSGRTVPTFNAAAAQSTNQNVNIYADFPNVSDALEIKNALNTLVNRASQMVSQNRRTY